MLPVNEEWKNPIQNRRMRSMDKENFFIFVLIKLKIVCIN